MKIKIVIVAMLCAVVATLTSCTPQQSSTQETSSLNISVFLDLSDRIRVPNQVYRDTAIVNYLVDYYISKTAGTNILKSKNRIKVLFYPMPQEAKYSEFAKELKVEIGGIKLEERKKALRSMKKNFPRVLVNIYNQALTNTQWPGCDIWDFFNSKKVDNLCIEKGARNILVILTDGFIFHENNLLQEGCCSYSYIVPNLLESKQEISLIDRRKGELSDKGLEVLVLEINPKTPQLKYKMTKILEDWFKSMGIEKISIVETDANLTNTQTFIKNFMNE